MSESDSAARLVGINHVALPVGDVEAATEFYGSVFEFDVRGRSDTGVFLDMGDQFLALMEASDDDAAVSVDVFAPTCYTGSSAIPAPNTTP